jgi:hypothetical protein
MGRLVCAIANCRHRSLKSKRIFHISNSALSRLRREYKGKHNAGMETLAARIG